MAAGAQARHLRDSHGSPGIWKIVLKAQVPQLNPKLKFPVVN